MYQGSQIQAFACRSGALASMRSCLHFASTCLKVYLLSKKKKKKKKFSCPLENPALNKIKQLFLSLSLISALFRASQGLRHTTIQWEPLKWGISLVAFHRPF